ncbi:hypothetical protein MSG28_015191 [Choristoneura fumiferana]|uniref:Uncharacterized protein n=1 Tax=Choristoneura fumiferana TaxID=7141 RepID=A0ACC0KZS8_CHOFU|nr:hypothetical protein MSG28_015191 [Choristoneura fumiferana]
MVLSICNGVVFQLFVLKLQSDAYFLHSLKLLYYCPCSNINNNQLLPSKVSIMSDEEQVITETQVLTADFKDGQLEIVEVTPYDNEGGSEHILPDMLEGSEDTEQKDLGYQILDSNSSKMLMNMDVLSLTLVKCGDGDGEESYRLVTAQEAAEGDLGGVTCVLQTSDNEDDGQNAYVGKKQLYLTSENQDQYVMMNGEDGPVVMLKSALEHTVNKQQKPKKQLSAVELLEKAKTIQKAKFKREESNHANASVYFSAGEPAPRRGRKRRGALPNPHDLLSSPNFKLFLYSCKLCSFKCNAIKELTAHKTTEHSDGAGKSRGGARAASTTLQCARCPFRGDALAAEVYLNSAEAEAADVLVCGACGFESASRPEFRKHIEQKHNAS